MKKPVQPELEVLQPTELVDLGPACKEVWQWLRNAVSRSVQARPASNASGPANAAKGTPSQPARRMRSCGDSQWNADAHQQIF